MKTLKIHQSLLSLENIIDLSQESNENKYNNPDEDVYVYV